MILKSDAGDGARPFILLRLSRSKCQSLTPLEFIREIYSAGSGLDGSEKNQQPARYGCFPTKILEISTEALDES